MKKTKNKQLKNETIRNYNPEKGWDKYKKSKMKVREFNLILKVKPEKQEKLDLKLREALRKDFKKLYVKEYTMGWRDQRLIRDIEIGVMKLDNLENLISQLIAEEMEELCKDIVDMTLCYNDGFTEPEDLGSFLDGQSHFKGHVLEKLSKLINNDENEE